MPGQSSDEELGLATTFNIKVYGDAAVVDWSLIQIGDISAGNYIELGPDGIKVFNEGTELDIWADVDSNVAQAEFRIAGVDATDADAHIALVATNFAGTVQNSFTLDTSADRATLDAEQFLIGESIRFLGMTTTERNALPQVNGTVVYNTTTSKLQVRAGGAWVDLH